jgi:hypothetical protein
MELKINTPEQEKQLVDVRIKAAEDAVKEAQEELDKAETETDKILWANRVEQRKTDLETLMDSLSKEEVAA